MRLPHLWVKSVEHFWWRCIEPRCQAVVLKEDLHRAGVESINPSNKVLNRFARRTHG